MWRNGNTFSLLMVMQNGIDTLEGNLAFLTKGHYVNILSGKYVSWYLLKWDENLCLHKTSIHIFIETLFIIVKTWKKYGCSSIDKLTIVWHLYNKIKFSDKRKWAIKSQNTWINPNTKFWVKEARSDNATYVGFELYGTLKRHSYGDSEKMNDCQGFKVRENMDMWRTVDFYDWNFCVTLWWWMHVINFVKIYKIYNTKSGF